MIKNERQYRITRAQAAKFKAALDAHRERAKTDTTSHPRMLKAQGDALRSQLESLERELEEYDELKSGRRAAPGLGYIENVALDLIRARIAAGLTQADLAERLGMPEQQIQRYESTEYESVSLTRILEIADALRKHEPVGRDLVASR